MSKPKSEYPHIETEDVSAFDSYSVGDEVVYVGKRLSTVEPGDIGTVTEIVKSSISGVYRVRLAEFKSNTPDGMYRAGLWVPKEMGSHLLGAPAPVQEYVEPPRPCDSCGTDCPPVSLFCETCSGEFTPGVVHQCLPEPVLEHEPCATCQEPVPPRTTHHCTGHRAGYSSSTSQKKPSNPKDAVGSTKPPLSCIPSGPLFQLGAALLSGSMKYGRHNYRVIGVRASIYYDAALRHLMQWWEGENVDTESGVEHLAHAMACMVILLDAESLGKLNDDRPPESHPIPQHLRDQVAHIIAKTREVVPAYTQLQLTLDAMRASETPVTLEGSSPPNGVLTFQNDRLASVLSQEPITTTFEPLDRE